MAKKNYGKLEQKVINIFSSEGTFLFEGESYKVLKVGKPQPQKGAGEPKTDVYILGVTESDKFKELKLSLKLKSSNEFQENKVNKERAETFFGEDYESIIEETTRSIADRFESQPLLYSSGKHPTKPNSITLGWKLEIASKPRKLSARIQLNEEQIRQFVYKGINLPPEKKHAIVNEEVIENSGVAEYILYAELADLKNSQDVISQMELIDDMEIEPTYLIFTANNYRTQEEKSDGARPIAVRIDWYIQDNKLAHRIVYDNPLSYCGKDLVPGLKEILQQLGKNHPSEMSEEDLLVPSILRP
ncbi:hypothetical protein [Bacillus cereus]|uniref:hypothetical protein n=1 Tax=Bacillus cereus TaxID=1396 RepID=UPI000BF6C7D6|nr:hypothetical protein [Bacillus cereus]PFM31008.1 hypothetical protein COJ43_28720 [Bacillus cereus]